MRILNNHDAAPDAVVIAAAAVVFFSVQEHADAIAGETFAIAQKLLRMTASVMDDVA